MVVKKLFQTFDPPDSLTTDRKAEQAKFKRSYYFDFEAEDFVKDGGNRVKEADGHTALAHWCIKVLQTERFSCYAYYSSIGIETEEVRRQPTRKAAESVLERTITEALLVHPMTDSVREFDYSWVGDNLTAEFTIYPKEGAPITGSTAVTT
jgi:hypothetical protein